MANRTVRGRTPNRILLDDVPARDDLAPNNLQHRSLDIFTSDSDEGGEGTRLSALQAFHRSLGEKVVDMPGMEVLVEAKIRQADNARLTDMIANFPDANRRFTPAEIRDWNGLTPVVEAVILQALKVGLPRRRAAAMAGVSLLKLKQWLDMAEKGLEPFANFALKFHQAEGLDEMKALQLVHNAAAAELKTTGTYLKLLERRHAPEDNQWDNNVDALPFDEFTVEELRAYTDSGGRVVPDRYKFGYKGKEKPVTDESQELILLREELRALKEKHDLSEKESRTAAGLAGKEGGWTEEGEED